MGAEVKLHALLTSATDGDDRSASDSGHFTLRKGAPYRVDPKVCLNISMNTKVPDLTRNQTPEEVSH
jgi:hypothetical protein